MQSGGPLCPFWKVTGSLVAFPLRGSRNENYTCPGLAQLRVSLKPRQGSWGSCHHKELLAGPRG